MDSKAFVWLLLALASIVAPLLFNYVFIFPLGPFAFGVLSLVMLALFAGSFLLLYAKFAKIKKNVMWILAFLLAFLLPLGYAYTQILPLVAVYLGWIILLMHFVFAAGVLVGYSQWKSIKKLI